MPPATLASRVRHIRSLRPGDGDLLDSVMAAMSSQSRYRRFHSPKQQLTPADRANLTDVDERNRLALVALADDGAPLGIAHAVRLRGDEAAAEIGVAIVDAFQGEGLGTELVSRLARRATTVGIERLVANVLAESALGAHLARHGWRMTERDGHTLTFEAAAWRVAARQPAWRLASSPSTSSDRGAAEAAGWA